MIEHPLPVDTKVEAMRANCPCTGGGFSMVEGKILKVISNHSGIWYYLDNGLTVKSDTVSKILV